MPLLGYEKESGGNGPITLTLNHPVIFADNPGWTPTPTVDLRLLEGTRNRHRGRYEVECYLQERISVPILGICRRKRITDNLAAYTAELVTILLALSWLETNRIRFALIASDSASASALSSIHHMYL